jgi:hypothetical protein
VGECGVHGHAQTGRVLDGLDGLRGFAEQLDGSLRVGDQPLAGRRQRRAAVATSEQLDPDDALETHDPLADGWLGYEQQELACLISGDVSCFSMTTPARGAWPCGRVRP